MDVFTLAVLEFADGAFLIEPAHLLIEDHVGVVLGEHVDATTLFDGPRQGDAFAECVTGGGFTHHVSARLECGDRKRGVLVEVVRQHDCVHVVLEEALELRVGGNAQLCADSFDPLLPPIAQGHELHTGMAGADGKAAAAAEADNANTNPARFRLSTGHDGLYGAAAAVLGMSGRYDCRRSPGDHSASAGQCSTSQSRSGVSPLSGA